MTKLYFSAAKLVLFSEKADRRERKPYLAADKSVLTYKKAELAKKKSVRKYL